MNLVGLSASYLRARPLQTVLSLLLLAIGVATVVMLLLVTSQLESRMGRDAQGIDLVVGAKGSPMQLILSGVYHVDVPTGNIPLAAAQAIQKTPLVRKAMPLALGDSWKGYRIVGAGREYPEHYGARIVSGRFFEKPLEVVLGAEVAKRTGMAAGGKFAGAHGIAGQGDEHGEEPFTVVGVLGRTGSVMDRLVLTSIESVWHVHHDEKEEAREVTVLLIQYATPLAVASLPRQINAQSQLQAASPAYESARLFSILGVGVDALRAFAAVLMLAAGLSVFIALYTALEERRYDLAIMRTLGASPGRLFGLLLGEGLLLALIGALLGVALGHVFASALGVWLDQAQQISVTGRAWLPAELWVAGAASAIGLAAALIPAWRAYRTDVAGVLAKG
jgi:putative ABC transport system permease protein